MLKDILERLAFSLFVLIFPIVFICFMPMLVVGTYTFHDTKQFESIDEAVVWQKDILGIAETYQTESIKADIGIQSPPVASYSVRLKPTGSGFLPERREFNGNYTLDSDINDAWGGLVITGFVSLLCMGIILWGVWSEPFRKGVHSIK